MTIFGCRRKLTIKIISLTASRSILLLQEQILHILRLACILASVDAMQVTVLWNLSLMYF
jgi:hypothetical protein